MKKIFFWIKNLDIISFTADASTGNNDDPISSGNNDPTPELESGIIFSKVELPEVGLITGINNITAFNSNIETTQDIIIKDLAITPIITGNLIDIIGSGSAKLVIAGEEINLSNLQIAGLDGPILLSDVNINITANEKEPIRLIFDTKIMVKPYIVEALVSYEVSILKTEDSGGVLHNHSNLKAYGDTIEIEAQPLIVTPSPIHINLLTIFVVKSKIYPQSEKEIGYFSVKKSLGNLPTMFVLKDINISFTDHTNISSENFIQIFSGNIRLVNKSNNEIIPADISIDGSGSGFKISNINYKIQQTSEIVFMLVADIGDFGTGVVGKKLQLKIDDIKFETAIFARNIPADINQSKLSDPLEFDSDSLEFDNELGDIILTIDDDMG